ncbi:MAG: YncE family protein [Pseudonocardiaceae bacterium]
MTRRRHTLAATLAALALLLSGCGAEPSDPAAPAPSPRLPPPAEPAEAPVPARPPTGQVVPVGPIAEGVVADPQTGLVAVGLRDPFRLALVDGRTGRLRRDVPLPGHLRHLQLQEPGGPVLVPAESANAFLRVALPSGDVVSRVPVGRFPHDATATAGGRFVVANEFGGTVSVVEDGRVVHTFDDATQPGGLAAVGERAGMVDVRENTLTVYDIAERERLAELPAGDGPTHVVADRRGRLLVSDTRGGAILVYSLEPEPRMVDRLPLPGNPYGISYDSARDRLWVTVTATNEVVGIGLDAGAPRIVTRLPTIRQPNTVAVDSTTGRIFVASPTEGALELIDPAVL